MKTLMWGSKKNGETIRTSEEEAKILVRDWDYRYVPKHCWVQAGRQNVRWMNNKATPLNR